MKVSRTVLLTLDQFLFSISSFVVLLIAAHSLELVQYGRFGLAIALYYVAQGLQRSLGSDVFIPRVRSEVWTMAHPSLRAARTGSLVVTVALAAGMSGVLVVLSDGGAGLAVPAFLAYTVALRFDFARCLLMAANNQTRLICGDAVYIVVACAAAAVSVWHPMGGVELWSLLGLGYAAGWSVARSREPRHVPAAEAWSWFRDTWSLTRFYLADFIAGSGLTQLAVALAAVVVSAQDLGRLRVVQTELGPQSFLAAAGGPVIMMLLAPSIRQGGGAAMKRLFLGNTGLVLLFLAYAGALAALGLDVLTRLFGANADVRSLLFLILALAGAASIYSVGVSVGLRVLESGRALLMVRLVSLVLLFAGTLAALELGVIALAVAVAAAQILYAVMGWAQVRRLGGREAAGAVHARGV